MTPFSEGVRIHDHIITPDAFTDKQLADAMYRLTADADDAALLLESCTPEEADYMLNPGVTLIAEAVSAVKNRLDRTMTALVRVFARHGDAVKPYEFPSIGPDRKNALFAYKTSTFTFDDGQTVSILFHSPGRDPMKLKADDTLIAYRWMLNRRDITAIVSPEKGRDINLQTMARRIMQLVEENSEKFQANNEKRQEQAEKLAALETEQADESLAVDRLTQQNADLSGQIESTDERIERLRARLEAHGEGDREGSGGLSERGQTAFDNYVRDTDRMTFEKKEAILNATGFSLEKVRQKGSNEVFFTIMANQPDGTQVAVDTGPSEEIRGGATEMAREAAQGRIPAMEAYQKHLQAEQASAATDTEGEPHYSELILKALQENHGWDRGNSLRPDGDLLSATKDVGGSISGTINPEGKRVVTATFRNDEERRRYLSLISGVDEAFDIDGRDALGKGEEGAAAVAAEFDRMTVKWAQDNAADPSTLKVGQADPEPQPEPEEGSTRVADYLSRIEQAETAKDVGAIGIEVENDANLSPEENQAVRDAIRDARVRFSQQEEAERQELNSPEQIDTVEGWQVSHGPFVDFTLTAQTALGVDSTRVNVKARNGITIGSIERDDVNAFTGGDASTFTPADNWKTAYSDELKQLMGLASPESSPAQEPDSLEALDGSLYRDISRSITVIRGIDLGTEQGYNRSLFSSSIANKLKTQARNGNEEVVDAALLLIAQQSLDHGRPILAKRNAIWGTTGNDMDYYMDIAQRQASADTAPAASEDEPPAPEEQDDTPAPAEPEPENTEPTEEDRIGAALQALLSETDSTAAIDALEALMDKAEAAGIDIDNDPNMLAASDHVTQLLEQESA